MSEFLTPVLWLIALALLWVAYNALLDVRLTGWRRLAAQFGSSDDFQGTVWKHKPGMLRGIYIWPTLVVGADQRGLYLARTWPFASLGFLPLLIPWQHVAVDTHAMRLWWSHLLIKVEPPLRLSLPPEMLRQIRDVAGNLLSDSV
jgi:hypothetical protein